MTYTAFLAFFLLVPVLVTAAFARTLHDRGRRLPASVLLTTCIAGQAVRWQLRYGGPMWIGRRAVA